MSLAAEVKERALEMGFHAAGIATVEPFPEVEKAFLERQGAFSGLRWFTPQRAYIASHPQAILPPARSIISVALSYGKELPESGGEGPRGRLSRYTQGQDYHRRLSAKLRELVSFMEKGSCQKRGGETRIVVDSFPLAERAVAHRAGVGWFGKNSNIFVPQKGSWVFLGEIISNVEMAPDQPLAKSCGNCRACIQACPTGAITAPYAVENDRCISFLTIELKGSLPRPLRPLMGDWIFGCDVCQEVCPVNRRLAGESVVPTLPLIPLLRMGEAEFNLKFAGRPMQRAQRSGLRRNAAVALGNLGHPQGLPALIEALEDSDPVLREHIAWALEQLGGKRAQAALEKAWRHETHAPAREEMALALGSLTAA
ncbi:MAG: tRNA epoxyqueuosine(34) reductase QueG [Chloroflexi bacterium]|nr:tRNA epoxyqueuosine(34) reductase QueG [Chloroflexota bacterium]